MSYRMEEREWPPVCDCRYDEVHDRMDRKDCCLHYDTEEEVSQPKLPTALKKPTAITTRDQESAA